MLRNSGRTPMPSGSMRISSSSPPGRSVGLMQPTTPRQLVNAMARLRFAASLVKPHALHARGQGEVVETGVGLGRRAGGDLVEQDRADVAARTIDGIELHDG